MLCQRIKARVRFCNAERANHAFLQWICDRFEEFVPSISPMGLILCFLASLTSALGPVTVEFISNVREDGMQSTWPQPAGNFFLFVAGPGQFKSGTMMLVHRALDTILGIFQNLKHSLGGTVSVHAWVDHLVEDAIFRDGSTSAWFERIKGTRCAPHAPACHLMFSEYVVRS